MHLDQPNEKQKRLSAEKLCFEAQQSPKKEAGSDLAGNLRTHRVFLGNDPGPMFLGLPVEPKKIQITDIGCPGQFCGGHFLQFDLQLCNEDIWANLYKQTSL